MKIDAIKRFHDATRFRPFAIRTAGGQAFDVPHREFMWIVPTEDTIAVAHPDGGANFIDASLVTEVELKKRHKR